MNCLAIVGGGIGTSWLEIVTAAKLELAENEVPCVATTNNDRDPFLKVGEVECLPTSFLECLFLLLPYDNKGLSCVPGGVDYVLFKGGFLRSVLPFLLGGDNCKYSKDFELLILIHLIQHYSS